jgi:hypothetical protein
MAYYSPYNTGFAPFPDAGFGAYAGIPSIPTVQSWVPQPMIFAPQSVVSSSAPEPEYENIFAPTGTLDDQIATLTKKKRFL